MDLETHLPWDLCTILYNLSPWTHGTQCTQHIIIPPILFSIILGQYNFLHKHTVELTALFIVYCVYAVTTEPKLMFWMAISWCHVSKPPGPLLPPSFTICRGWSSSQSQLHLACKLLFSCSTCQAIAKHVTLPTVGWCLLRRAETLRREQGMHTSVQLSLTLLCVCAFLLSGPGVKHWVALRTQVHNNYVVD